LHGCFRPRPVKNWRASPAPLTGVPVNWAELVVAMAKGYWAWWLVRSHGVKGKHDLATVLHPAAMLGHLVFANVKGVENGCAIRSEVEGENPFRGIRRRRVALISTSKISILPPGKAYRTQLGSGTNGWNQPAKRQQGTTNCWTGANQSGGGEHDEWIIDAVCTSGQQEILPEWSIGGQKGGERKGRMMRLYMRQSFRSRNGSNQRYGNR
jgi:hypothetical protein